MPRTSASPNQTLPKEQEHYCVIVQESKTKLGRKFIKILIPKLWRLDTIQNTLLITSETRETMKIIFFDYPKIKIVYNEDNVSETISGKRLNQKIARNSTKKYNGCVDSFKKESSRLPWEDPLVFKYSSKQGEKKNLLLFRFPPIEDFLDQPHSDSKWNMLFKSLLVKVSNENDLIFFVLDRTIRLTSGFSSLQHEVTLPEQRETTTSETKKVVKASKLRRRRLQRPKQSRTAMKSQSLAKLLSPEFRRFFRQYASTGSPLKSGAAITRSNSNFWLHNSGLLSDPESIRLASTLFIAVAGSKVVLGIFDYLRFLMLFARQKQLIPAEVVLQMIEEGKQHFPFRKRTRGVCENIEPLPARSHIRKSASLPNLLKMSGETELFRPREEQMPTGSYNGIF